MVRQALAFATTRPVPRSGGRRLPRFLFNVRDGVGYPDRQGTELPDLNAARNEAIRFSGALLKDQPETYGLPSHVQAQVPSRTLWPASVKAMAVSLVAAFGAFRAFGRRKARVAQAERNPQGSAPP